MALITRSEFDLWKSNPVTKEFLQALQERIDEMAQLLVQSAGISPTDDNFNRGYIRALFDISQFEVNFDEENPDE